MNARAVTLVAALVLGGCAAERLDPHLAGAHLPDAAHIAGVRHFPQTAYQCGPAALATLLTHSGVEITPAELEPSVYLPGRRGSLQAELKAATRRQSRLPYTRENDIASLFQELDNTRPVLVLLNLGFAFAPIWHYAVAVGYDADRNTVITHSGREAERHIKWPRFLRGWRGADHWALLALRAGEFPIDADPGQYIDELLALERVSPAVSGYYAAATARWPDQPATRFGWANALLAEGQLREAERGYRSILVSTPNHAAARNNLANLLLEMGRCGEARTEIERALEHPGAEFAEALADTRSSIVAKCGD